MIDELTEFVGNAIGTIFPARSATVLKKLAPRVTLINGLEAKLARLTDNELKAKTEEFRRQIAEIPGGDIGPLPLLGDAPPSRIIRRRFGLYLFEFLPQRGEVTACANGLLIVADDFNARAKVRGNVVSRPRIGWNVHAIALADERRQVRLK